MRTFVILDGWWFGHFTHEEYALGGRDGSTSLAISVRAALLVAQDVEVVAGALCKLFSGVTKSQVNVQAFLQQWAEYEAQLSSANPLVRLVVRQQLQSRTHPLPVQRGVALDKWSRSDDYARILVKGKPLAVVVDYRDEETVDKENGTGME